MYCRLCRKSKKNNTFTEGCQNFRRKTVEDHVGRLDHVYAIEADLNSTIRPLSTAAVRILQQNEEAIIHVAAMRCVYWLAKTENPTHDYSSLIDLHLMQGVTCLKKLFVGANATYRSHHIAEEMQSAIVACIDEDIRNEIGKYCLLGIMADESADISTNKSMIIYCKAFASGKEKTFFLKNEPITSATADSLTELLLNVMQLWHIPISKVIGFGSDGARVMTGCHNGVGAQLSQTQPYLIAIHCVAHRLSLAAVQAADGIALLEKYERTLNAIYKYFSTSSSRQNPLKNIHQILDSPVLKYKQIFDVRWLSFGNAIEAVFRTLPALLTTLENDAEALGEPTASGLAKFISTYHFIALTYFLADVL